MWEAYLSLKQTKERLRGMSQASTDDAGLPVAISEDALMGGRVRLLQPAKGYRAGMDAALLAAACDATAGERVLDVGCGPWWPSRRPACAAARATPV